MTQTLYRSIATGLLATGLVLGMAACKNGDKKSSSAQGGDAAAVASSGEAAPKPVNRVVKANGLVIEDLVEGTGDICLPRATIRVRYSESLQDGTALRSTMGVADPDSIALGKMIKGWQDGLPGMRVGGKRRLTVPSSLAYGDVQKQDKEGKIVIPAKSTLVYDIELVGIGPKPGASEGAAATTPASSGK